MRQFLLIVISIVGLIYGAIGMNVGGPVIVWSNQKDLDIGQDQNVVDLHRLFQAATHFDGAAVAFIDSELSSQRIASIYQSLAPLATTAPFKSFERSSNPLNRQTIQEASGSLNVSPPSTRTIENNKLTIVDISQEVNPVTIINDYMTQLGDRPHLLILSSPMVDVVEQQNASLIESQEFVIQEQQRDGDQSPITQQLRRLQAVEVPNEIHLRPHDLPAVLFMIFFAILLLIGITCLADVNTPVSYEDKTLTINKEF